METRTLLQRHKDKIAERKENGHMDTAEKIVTAIIADLTDRAGLDSLWDSFDETIKDEIYTTWAVKARSIIDEVQVIKAGN